MYREKKEPSLKFSFKNTFKSLPLSNIETFSANLQQMSEKTLRPQNVYIAILKKYIKPFIPQKSRSNRFKKLPMMQIVSHA